MVPGKLIILLAKVDVCFAYIMENSVPFDLTIKIYLYKSKK